MRVIQILIFGALACLNAKAFHSSLQFRVSASLIPHPQKIEKGGEDAYFASHQLLIVADGVGGWNNHGIDPGLYSKFLCSESQKLYQLNSQYYTQHPQKLIEESTQNNLHQGSSTMSVVTLRDNVLRTCHIGDCKLFVLRRYGDYHLIYQSTDQLHGFNFPFQLGLPENRGDDPSHAICTTLTVKSGDLVVLTSDGFADNLFPNQLVQLAEEHYKKNTLSKLSKELTRIATKRASIKSGDSPFAAKARQWNVDYIGGKIDDTTVLVAEIIKAEKAESDTEL